MSQPWRSFLFYGYGVIVCILIIHNFKIELPSGNCGIAGDGNGKQSIRPTLALDVNIATLDHVVFPRNSSHSHPANPPDESNWLLNSALDTSASSHTIPRRVHKIYLQRDGQFPSEGSMIDAQREALSSWEEKNPGYTVQFFNLGISRSYLAFYFHPIFLRTFDCLQAFAHKSDFLRIAVLYREGGYYSDWKQVCTQQNLLDAIANETNFFVFYDEGCQKRKGCGTIKCVQNAFVGATSRHPIIAKALRGIFTNVQTAAHGANAIHPTTCQISFAISQKEEEELGVFFGKLGADADSHHYYRKGKKAIRNKCEGCGLSQNWEHGNSYIELWKSRNCFCQDAASLFESGVLHSYP